MLYQNPKPQSVQEKMSHFENKDTATTPTVEPHAKF